MISFILLEIRDDDIGICNFCTEPISRPPPPPPTSSPVKLRVKSCVNNRKRAPDIDQVPWLLKAQIKQRWEPPKRTPSLDSSPKPPKRCLSPIGFLVEQRPTTSGYPAPSSPAPAPAPQSGPNTSSPSPKPSKSRPRPPSPQPGPPAHSPAQLQRQDTLRLQAQPQPQNPSPAPTPPAPAPSPASPGHAPPAPSQAHSPAEPSPAQQKNPAQPSPAQPPSRPANPNTDSKKKLSVKTFGQNVSVKTFRSKRYWHPISMPSPAQPQPSQP